MPRKDRRYREDSDYAEKSREYQRNRYREDPDFAEKSREYQRNYRKIKNPNIKRRDSYHDFETHRELAMSSGIQSYNEWRECFKLGLMPDGIYSSPDREFRRNGRNRDAT